MKKKSLNYKKLRLDFLFYEFFIPTVTIQNVCNARLMHANYGLVWVYNALKSVIGCLRDRQNFSESSVWHWRVNTLQVWREHFVKFMTSLLI